jgi:hypothetical protein
VYATLTMHNSPRVGHARLEAVRVTVSLLVRGGVTTLTLEGWEWDGDNTQQPGLITQQELGGTGQCKCWKSCGSGEHLTALGLGLPWGEGMLMLVLVLVLVLVHIGLM